MHAVRWVVLVLGLIVSSGHCLADALPNSSITSGCILQGAGGQYIGCTGGGTYGASAKGIATNVLGDAATFSIPSNITKYRITDFFVTNCSSTPILAQLAIYTVASQGGTNATTAGTITAANALTAIASLSAKTISLTASTLYLNVTVANALSLTCDAYIHIQDLS